MVSDIERPTDPDALRYDEYWRPVLQGATLALLDRLDAIVAPRIEPGRPSPTLLDMGCGTGSLILAAAARWPTLRTIGLDASAAMLGLARERARDSAGTASIPPRWLVADAASIPLDEASVDIVTSSFMLQLVADRAAVLADVRRVLVPGGTFAFVTWLAEDVMLPADEAFDDVVYELEIDEPDGGFRAAKAGDFEDVEAAARELRAAGFGHIDARPERLERCWTRSDFLDFKRAYDERELFDSLDERDRARLAERVMARWAALPDEAFVLHAPLVSVIASAD